MILNSLRRINKRCEQIYLLSLQQKVRAYIYSLINVFKNFNCGKMLLKKIIHFIMFDN